MDAAGWANSAAVATQADRPATASGRNVTSTPAASVDAENTPAGRSSPGYRSRASTPSPCEPWPRDTPARIPRTRDPRTWSPRGRTASPGYP
ncbi:MAG TPA: hypothetical protein VGM53_11410 [Streptosporangiaceae bacterium]